jgi:hypothetical protein
MNILLANASQETDKANGQRFSFGHKCMRWQCSMKLNRETAQLLRALENNWFGLPTELPNRIVSERIEGIMGMAAQIRRITLA